MATVKEIAEAAGCSPSTVSIVLGGKAAQRKISEDTQQRILEAAGRLGYRPNIAARSLRGGSGAQEVLVAVFWAQDFRAQMLVRFLDGLRQEIARQERPIRLVVFPYQNDRLCDMSALTSASDCHAAIICNASRADLDFLSDTKLFLPVVLYNRICRGYSSVNVDDAHMGALAARAFADQGCRSAAILTGAPVFEGMDVRVQGFVLEGSRHGLQVSETRYCENSLTGGYDTARRLLQRDWRDAVPDAVFCGSAMIAHGLLRALWQEGFPPERQPKVVAIGNGSAEQDAYSIPSLSVVQMPMEDMAGACLELLMETMENRLPPTSRILEVEYLPRESCGPITED